MTPENTWFGQNNVDCRLEWGRRGARSAAERGDILVVIDVLSFSTAVATAVEKGAILYPCGKDEDADALASRLGAVVAVRREEVPGKGAYSLSPQTLLSASPSERIVVQSPNGATCSRYGSSVPLLLAGALVNASAVAAVATKSAEERDAAITLLACGERWHSSHEEGDLRFALEDYLGAGAILAHLPSSLTRSPEARASEAAFIAAANHLPETLQSCGSGIELIQRGYPEDVEHAGKLNLYSNVPVLQEGLYFSAVTL